MACLDDEAVRVFEEVMHGHVICQANGIILGLEDKEWYVNVRNETITKQT